MSEIPEGVVAVYDRRGVRFEVAIRWDDLLRVERVVLLGPRMPDGLTPRLYAKGVRAEVLMVGPGRLERCVLGYSGHHSRSPGESMYFVYITGVPQDVPRVEL